MIGMIYVRCGPADADARLPGCIHLRWRCPVFRNFRRGLDLFAFMPYRIMSVMQNTVLMAVPLFIFMGVVLQRTRLEQLLTSMGRLFGGLPGGLGYLDDSGRCTAGSLYRCCRCQRGCHGPDLAARHAGA